jgi:hypothetical protein
MTDQELLELAAKACGLEEAKLRIEFNQWNPLTDDGDALRLAVKLNFLTTECVEDWKWCRDKAEHAKVCEHYRCAITRAAAEIGKGMK